MELSGLVSYTTHKSVPRVFSIGYPLCVYLSVHPNPTLPTSSEPHYKIPNALFCVIWVKDVWAVGVKIELGFRGGSHKYLRDLSGFGGLIRAR